VPIFIDRGVPPYLAQTLPAFAPDAAGAGPLPRARDQHEKAGIPRLTPAVTTERLHVRAGAQVEQ